MKCKHDGTGWQNVDDINALFALRKSEIGRGAAREHYGSLSLDVHVASTHIHTQIYMCF